ncbi:hypothetical protein BDU57DRAFT_514896 [Ampelomyces quisqualis]|uniref:Cytidyltransferase-like domain-containing protein n=1 Tax=Ampelomyces quisqualis TaxID=50730 RepID=A0A6A5QS32_AMPQU|nr:hypothetical protein BDU57DRAFT_514896 [Ampelomyces quisqualis]
MSYGRQWKCKSQMRSAYIALRIYMRISRQSQCMSALPSHDVCHRLHDERLLSSQPDFEGPQPINLLHRAPNQLQARLMTRPKKTQARPQRYKKALLAKYVRTALEDEEATVFQHSNRPELVSNKVCHILTYRGSFNPPHQGHKDVLCHGFFRGGLDLNIVAAFVYFLNDETVDRKYNYSPVDVVFRRAERIKLFNGGDITGGWHYCYPGSIDYQYDFQNQVRAQAAEDGFQIEFLILCGPDLIREGARADPGNRLVVGTGDPERTFFRAQTETGLRRLQGYGSWEMKSWTESFEQHFDHKGPNKVCLESKLKMLFPHLVSMLPETDPARTQEANRRLRTALSRIGGNRHCKEVSAVRTQWIRYVALQYFGMTGGTWFVGAPEKRLSSTRIRHILDEEEDECAMFDALSGVALSPALLVEFVRERRQQKLIERAGALEFWPEEDDE